MTEINVKEARRGFSSLLDQVEAGEEIVISRRGKRIARLVPNHEEAGPPAPSLKEFRASISLKGKPLSQTVIRERKSERY